MRAKESKIARRGLPSSRRFFRALTAAPLRLAIAFWFARMVRGDLKEAVMSQILIPNDIRERLLANGARSAAGEDIDPIPVVKLFTPDANATWLLTELNANEIAFGLCDLGLGSPELGYVDISEIVSLRGPMGLPVERDEHYTETRSLSVLANLARQKGAIR